jgi:translation initiation factor 1 (eIF-1/SUI1)
VKLFQEMGASTSEPLSQPTIRGYIYDYISVHNLVDAKSQSQIRLGDPILVHALYPKASLDQIPASLTRQELVDRLLATSCVEYHRSSRLESSRAAVVQQINLKGKSSKQGDTPEPLRPASENEFVGEVTKGTAKPVTIDIKSRQGRKVVTLITGLEVYGMDPHSLAHDLMKLGASASGECRRRPRKKTWWSQTESADEQTPLMQPLLFPTLRQRIRGSKSLFKATRERQCTSMSSDTA